MKQFWGIFLFSIHNVFAYSLSDLHISEREFHLYVKPQLINISQDFYTLLGSINPENRHLKPLVTIFKEVKTNLESLEKICQKTDKKSCLDLFAKTNALLDNGLTLFSVKSNFNDKVNFSPNDLLISFEKSFQFKNLYKNFHFKFNNIHFFYTSGINSNIHFPELKKDIEFCENLFNDYLIESSDGQFRSEFLSFWSEFIRPVNNIILRDDDFSLFIRKLNDLNLRLNFLNVALTKRNKEINSQANSLVKTIHNRWNSILKITLRR